MTQQETHPDQSRTPSTTPVPQWYGEAEERGQTTTAPDPGYSRGGYGFGTPDQTARPATGPGETPSAHEWFRTPAAGSGNGGGHEPHPPAAPAPGPKARPSRGIGQLTAVALLAAALASGGTYAATRAATPAAPVAAASTTTQNGTGTAPQVIQGSATAPDWTATAKAVAPSVVSITVTGRTGEGQGSGVVIDTSGHILTNNHVATGAGTGATISVTLNDGRTYDATIVGTDASTDLAVLKLSNGPSDLTPIAIGDSSALTVGQPVMAIGNPLGLSGTVTTGIVSALNRPVTTSAAESQQGQTAGTTADSVVTNAIQTSAAINPGNSGGALVTADGKLIGINSSIASLGSSGGQSGSIGIGFAIPVNEAKPIADQLIATGTAQHAYIGVSAADTTVTDGSSKRQAALVKAVSAGTPAASAGLQAQDAVIAVDGQPIDSSESLVATIHERKVGDTVTLTVIRGSQKQDIKITLAARPG
jgi:putative serine protease PepD